MGTVEWFVAIGFGMVAGWAVTSMSVAKVVDPHLRADAPEEVIDFADELFWALIPWPLSSWIDRHAERTVGKRKGGR